MTTKVQKIKDRHLKIGVIIIFIAPVMIYYSIFIVYPILATIYNSFHTMTPLGGRLVTIFVGLKNYKELLHDEIFFKAVGNTTIWAIVGPSIEIITATILAFIVYFQVPFYRFYRFSWFAPQLITGVIIGIVFKWIFNYDWGLLNVALRALGLNSFALNWLGRTDTPLWVAIFAHYWNTFGYSFILLLAGLSTIDNSILESARIDGASTIRICRSILFPLLLPIFTTTLILSFMGKMRTFNIVWVLTNGGPMHASETVATYVQKRAFEWTSLDLGYPSAISVFWFIMVIVGVAFISRWMSKKTKY